MNAKTQQKNAKREEIVHDLTLNTLRVKLLSHLQRLLIYNELDLSGGVEVPLKVMSVESFHQVAEERFNGNTCCNL